MANQSGYPVPQLFTKRIVAAELAHETHSLLFKQVRARNYLVHDWIANQLTTLVKGGFNLAKLK